MKSLSNLLHLPAGEPLLADDVLELHAARLLLLIELCGTKSKATGLNRLDGLTKMAKLDFLVRYPEFYERLALHLGAAPHSALHSVESSMVRFHYGPWDERYYHILAYLEAKRLLTVNRDGSAFRFELTESGKGVATSLSASEAFAPLAEHVKQVKALVGKLSGSRLKTLIYEVFGTEVGDRRIGEEIT